MMHARTSFGPEKRFTKLHEFFYADDIHLEIQVPLPGENSNTKHMVSNYVNFSQQKSHLASV